MRFLYTAWSSYSISPIIGCTHRMPESSRRGMYEVSLVYWVLEPN